MEYVRSGDTSETERTVTQVDSSFSQTSDTEKDAVEASTSIYVVNESSSTITDGYYSSDCQDNEDDIPFLGDVLEYDDDFAKNTDDPIVAVALDASKKLLDNASIAYNTDFSTTALTSDLDASPSSPDKDRMEQLYIKLDQDGNILVERGDSELAVIKYLQALYYKREALLMICPEPVGHTTIHHHKEDQKRFQQKQHILASIATSMNNLAFLQHNQSRIDAGETLALYQTALQIKRHVLGHQHLSVGKTLNNIGSIHYIQREFHMAAQTYEEARTILQLHLGNHHLDVCTVTSNIGDVHCSMKQWTCAVKEYRAALELRWPLYGPSDPKNIRLMEQIAEIEMLINQLNAQKDDNDHGSSNEKSYGPIIKDVRKLHKEVRRDIAHIDRQLASHLPLEMMKEKITVYREIRDIMKNHTIDDLGVDYDDYSQSSVNNDENSPYDVVEKHISAFKASTIETVSNANSFDVVVTLGKTVSTANSFDVVVASGKEQITTPPTTAKMTSPRLRSVEVSAPKKLSSPQLTSEERQKALISVKDKLAKLRAQRQIVIPSPMKEITDSQ